MSCRPMVTLMRTDEYERLVKFFVDNELEFDGDEEVDTDIVECFKIVDPEDHLLAAAVLARREGEFIIDGIAVDPAFRKFGLGKILLNKVKSEVENLGGDSIALVARAPEFFRKNEFETVDPNTAPNFFECKQCPQYRKTCFPEIMRLSMKKAEE
ncbi:GNAT family N-acetyltransferase [Eubacteriales bacterium KG127]